MNSLKIAIIGYGRVGSQVASLLSTLTTPNLELTIIDPSAEVEGSVLDTISALAGAGIDAKWNNDAALSEFDFIFYCAGPSVPANGDRMAVRAESLALVEHIFQGQELKSSAFIITLSNPLDVVAHHLWKGAGLAAGQIIGTGTLLDTYRVQMLIADHLNVSVAAIDCMVLGEHGQSMVTLWDSGQVDGKPLSELISQEDQNLLQDRLVNMAKTIKKTQDATYFGVARSAFAIFEALIGDVEVTLPVSVYLDEMAQEQLAVDPLFMSWPSTVRNGSVSVHESMQFSTHELDHLKRSAQKILAAIKA